MTTRELSALPGRMPTSGIREVFGGAGEGYVRFSYATDTETLETAMDRIEGMLGPA